MSEPIYETPNDVPSILINRSTNIISYIIGSTLSNHSNKSKELFDSKQKSDCLIAFTANDLILGKLNNGNSSTNLSIAYSSIKYLNYYEKSRKLEIVTGDNEIYPIKVSKNLLNSSLKNIDYDFKINYLKDNHKILKKLKFATITMVSSIIALGLLYKIFF